MNIYLFLLILITNLAHNHPSGNLKPSRHDEDLTNKIKEAAKYHDIKVLESDSV